MGRCRSVEFEARKRSLGGAEMRSFHLALALISFVLAGGVPQSAGLAGQKAAKSPEPAAGKQLVAAAAVTSWAIQLQGDLTALTAAQADLVVVDPDHVRWSSSPPLLRARTGGKPRMVLAYLSIGEAETERPYWAKCCADRPPEWATRREQGWAGNLAVRFWHADWQGIVKARLQEIIAAGYDGVYLDRADIWEVMVGERGSAREDMIAFLRDLSRLAKETRPGFIVFGQNAEELLDDASYLAALDGFAKEDLLHGVGHDGKRNPDEMIRHSVGEMKRVAAAGKPVLVVEYLPDGPLGEAVRREIAALGFIPFFTGRNLDGTAEPAAK